MLIEPLIPLHPMALRRMGGARRVKLSEGACFTTPNFSADQLSAICFRVEVEPYRGPVDEPDVLLDYNFWGLARIPRGYRPLFAHYPGGASLPIYVADEPSAKHGTTGEALTFFRVGAIPDTPEARGAAAAWLRHLQRSEICVTQHMQIQAREKKALREM